MTEPDVTLTDYALTLLCSYFAWRLAKLRTVHRLARSLWVGFFASVALGALFGGTVHGFFLDEASLGYRILWPATLFMLGITAASGWVLSGILFSSPDRVKPWLVFASSILVIYSVVIFFYSQQFIVAILHYAPAMIALLIASVRCFRRSYDPGFLWLTIGITLGFVAAFIQLARISIHPMYFNHNATYHLVQAIGLWVMFKGSSNLITLQKLTKD